MISSFIIYGLGRRSATDWGDLPGFRFFVQLKQTRSQTLANFSGVISTPLFYEDERSLYESPGTIVAMCTSLISPAQSNAAREGKAMPSLISDNAGQLDYSGHQLNEIEGMFPVYPASPRSQCESGEQCRRQVKTGKWDRCKRFLAPPGRPIRTHLVPRQLM
jgi:hypothetical protein